MNKQIEALKMAIEALDLICVKITKWTSGSWILGEEVSAKCKEALAEAEKQEWQSLSDDKIASVIKTTFPVNIGVTNVDLKFARAIEQALKEKNHG